MKGEGDRHQSTSSGASFENEKLNRIREPNLGLGTEPSTLWGVGGAARCQSPCIPIVICTRHDAPLAFGTTFEFLVVCSLTNHMRFVYLLPPSAVPGPSPAFSEC